MRQVFRRGVAVSKETPAPLSSRVAIQKPSSRHKVRNSLNIVITEMLKAPTERKDSAGALIN